MVGGEVATSAVAVVDTSTPSTVVTAGVDGVEIARFEHDGFHHLECIGDLVARSEQALIDRGVRLGAIGVVVGPGGFSGLRIGVSFASVFAFARQLPVVALSALELTARSVEPAIRNRFVVLDGQRSEVFYALYRADGDVVCELGRGHCPMEEILQHVDPSWLEEASPEWILFGSGVVRYRDRVPTAPWLVVGDPEDGLLRSRPWIAETFRLWGAGMVVDPEEVEVLYLRDADARANVASVLLESRERS